MIEKSRRFAIGLAILATCGPACAQGMPTPYQQVLDFLGRKGDFKDRVLKVNIPRSDLKVTVDGVATPTPFGFGGWIAMTPNGRGTDVMMGDLVLLQDEVNPVMSALLENGLEVTALHNHFFWEEPRMFYMHVHGMGSPVDLAHRVKPALDLIGHVSTPTGMAHRAVTVAAPAGVHQGDLNTSKLDQVIGHKGEQLAAGVYKYTIGRSDLRERHMGAIINSRMGLNTWAAFYGSDHVAVVAGDIAMLQDEVTPVLKALRANRIDIVAIHHHMTDAQPVIIFLHYWGKGPAEELAAGFRAALDQLGKGRAR